MKYGITLTTKSLLVGNPQHGKIQGRNLAVQPLWTASCKVIPGHPSRSASSLPWRSRSSVLPWQTGLLLYATRSVRSLGLLFPFITSCPSWVLSFHAVFSHFNFVNFFAKCYLDSIIHSMIYFPTDYLSLNSMLIHKNCLKHDAAKLFNSTLAEPHRLLWET